eukprot:COSAG05_NODE_2496_length_2982_cov_28.024974_3_plen_145_part_00
MNVPCRCIGPASTTTKRAAGGIGLQDGSEILLRLEVGALTPRSRAERRLQRVVSSALDMALEPLLEEEPDVALPVDKTQQHSLRTGSGRSTGVSSTGPNGGGTERNATTGNGDEPAPQALVQNGDQPWTGLSLELSDEEGEPPS